MHRFTRRALAASLLGTLLASAVPSHALTIVLDSSTGADYDAVGDGWFFTTPPNQPPDGVGDLGGNDLAVAYQAGVVELRAMAEFPLAPLAGYGPDDIVSATVTYLIDDVLSTFGPGTTFDGTAADPIALYSYPADGTVTTADFSPAGLSQLDIVTTGVITDPSLSVSGAIAFDVDATQHVKDFLTASETHFGVLFGTLDSPTGTSIDGKMPPGVAGGALPYITIEIADPTTTTTSSTTTTTSTIATTSTTTTAPPPTTTTTTLPPVISHPQAALKLTLKTKPSAATLSWVSKTPPMVLPTSDPTVVGATLEVSNPTTLESGTASMPAASWTKNNSGTIYKYKNPSAPGGPSVVKLAILKDGKQLKVAAKGTLITLDEATQGTLDVSLTIGSDVFCSSCSTPTKDVGGGTKNQYMAKGCPAPVSCQ